MFSVMLCARIPVNVRMLVSVRSFSVCVCACVRARGCVYECVCVRAHLTPSISTVLSKCIYQF